MTNLSSIGQLLVMYDVWRTMDTANKK